VASDGFYGIWEPRIGRDATDILRSRAKLSFIPVFMLVLIVAFAVALHGPAYYAAAGAVVVLGIPSYLVRLRSANRRLASAITDHLGRPVSSKTLPRFRTAAMFDAWMAHSQAGTPQRERSFFGGFVKIRLPPK
jgi:hypothetical protein